MIFNWWKRHPRWRMRLWQATTAPEWQTPDEFRHMRDQFRRESEQAWRER